MITFLLHTLVKLEYHTEVLLPSFNIKCCCFSTKSSYLSVHFFCWLMFWIKWVWRLMVVGKVGKDNDLFGRLECNKDYWNLRGNEMSEKSRVDWKRDCEAWKRWEIKLGWKWWKMNKCYYKLGPKPSIQTWVWNYTSITTLFQSVLPKWHVYKTTSNSFGTWFRF